MGENSAIGWTDHSFNPWYLSSGLRVSPKLNLMRKLMARFTKCYAVPNVEPMVGIGSERQYVMSIKVASPIIAAMGARKLIAQVNVVSPSLQFSGHPQAITLRTLAINVTRCVSATLYAFASDCAYLGSRLKRVLLANAITGVILSGLTHLCSRLSTVYAPLERRRPAFSGRSNRYMATWQALSVTPAVSGAVFSEVGGFFPRLTLRATFQPVTDHADIGIHCDPCVSCCGYQSTCFGLGHRVYRTEDLPILPRCRRTEVGIWG